MVRAPVQTDRTAESMVEILKELRGIIGERPPTEEEFHKEIKFLVEEQLRARGMNYAVGEPDAYVAGILLVNTQADAESIKMVFGDKADTTNLQAGALVVGLVDAKMHKTVWAGAAVAQAKQERTDAQAKERLAAAVKKIFNGFPR